MMKTIPIWFVGVFVLASLSAIADSPPALCFSRGAAPVEFAAGEIRRALTEKGLPPAEIALADFPDASGATRFVLVAGAEEMRRITTRLDLAPFASTTSQSYGIRRQVAAGQTNYVVLGADAVGAMYGGLDLAEAARLGRLPEMETGDHNPHIARRGIKFNIPLDLRTPSYSDCSDSFQANIPEMWRLDFWREFLDEMARNRFNVLTLWSLHPFPSLVKVPEYPEVALNDVWRTKLKLDDTFSHSGSDMVRPAMLERHEVVNQISIEEKIRFWREVMQYAHDRGIEVYLFTWNIFVWGAQGKYGITPSQTNLITIDYFRKSVRETVLTYPLLAGMGVTAGEQMENGQGEFSKEKWLWKTYGEGVRDALRQQPGRQFRLIHRFHMTGQSEILREWKEYPGPFDFSFKYAIAHMYAMTNPPFLSSALPHLPPDKRTWLTVRNDDIYSFRWGDPGFARDFIRCLPGPDKLAGFYMGPDGYCWGREFIDTEPETPRRLVMQKQWYSFLLWGRLSYDPAIPDFFFERVLAQRFPEVPADKLFSAWAAASKVFPQITRFFWGDIDVRWFPEACLSHPRVKGFYTVRHFMEGSPMPGSGCLNIGTWRQRVLNKQAVEGITPLQVAENLENCAKETLRLVGELRSGAGLSATALPNSPKTAGKDTRAPYSKELRLTLGDLEAFAWIGHYYAAKIRGAADLALFDATSQASQQASAVRHLESALDHWKRYAVAATRQYQPQLLNRVGYVDLNELTAKVQQDIEIARAWKPGTINIKSSKSAGADRPFVP